MDDAGGKGVSDGAVRLTYVDDMGGIDDLDGVVYVCDVGLWAIWVLRMMRLATWRGSLMMGEVGCERIGTMNPAKSEE